MRTFRLICALALTISSYSALAAAQPVPIKGNVPGFQMTGGVPADPNTVLCMSIRLAWQNSAALTTLLTNLQTPGNPQYHQFVSKSSFLATYAPSQSQVQSLITWLTGQGFKVGPSGNAGQCTAMLAPYSYPSMFIDFSGTVQQAESAFAISIVSNGKKTYENTTSPSLPSSLAGTVAFIAGLDNLAGGASVCPTPVPGPTPTPAPAPAKGFKPSDLHTYYNETPLLNGGNGGTTSPDCIAIIAGSDFSDSQFQAFANAFGLPATLPSRQLVDLSQPLPPYCYGQSGNGEVSLDTEWSHAVAPNTPQVVFEYNQAVPLGLMKGFDAMVMQDSCGVISSSIGPACSQDDAQFIAYDQVFEQAAAQGQTVFQAAGDFGAAGESLYQSGSDVLCGGGGDGERHVSEITTSPNVTSVGGTQFDPQYDSSGNDISVVGQTVESVWNSNGGKAGAGGVSSIFPVPPWQESVASQLKESMRLFPDLALGASASQPGFKTYELNDYGTPILTNEGGTSIATPMWAGLSRVLAFAAGTTRLGNINPLLYAQSGSSGESIPGIVDITTGNNTAYGITGYDAGPGFDLATGWGVPDMGTFVPAFAQAIAPSPTPTAVPTATAAPTPTALPTATPTPGASAGGANTTTSGRAGQTIAAGALTFTNTTRLTESIAQVSIQISDPALFSSLSLSASGNGTTQTATSGAPAATTVFSFSPALTVAAGATVTLTLNGTLASTVAGATPLIRFAGMIPAGLAPTHGAALLLGAVLPLGLSLLMLPADRRRRISLALLMLLAVAATQAGCGSSSSQSLLGSSVQQVPANGIAVTNTAGPVSVAGLPATLGTVKLIN